MQEAEMNEECEVKGLSGKVLKLNKKMLSKDRKCFIGLKKKSEFYPDDLQERIKKVIKIKIL